MNEKSILFCLWLLRIKNFNFCPFPKKLFSDNPIVACAPLAEEYPPPNVNSPVLVSSTSMLRSISLVLKGLSISLNSTLEKCPKLLTKILDLFNKTLL